MTFIVFAVTPYAVAHGDKYSFGVFQNVKLVVTKSDPVLFFFP
jgi:hypothetical protein